MKKSLIPLALAGLAVGRGGEVPLGRAILDVISRLDRWGTRIVGVIRASW